MTIRSVLYHAARLIGDANAVRRGRVIKRIARKALWKHASRAINKLVKP